MTEMEANKDNTKSPDDIFYSWECVSIMVETRTIDFVIKNRTHMFAFLKILLTFMKQRQNNAEAKKHQPSMFKKTPVPKSREARKRCEWKGWKNEGL